MTAKILGPIGVRLFDERGIGAETPVRFSVYTASRGLGGDIVADEEGDIVVFPFEEHGVCVSEKYRAPGKKFWQRQGGKRTFWNADVLDDPALEQGTNALIITEGEIDALTAIDCGFPFTVSVPDGAPAVPDGKAPADLEEIDPAHEPTGKFEFLWNNRDRLKRVKRFVLAVDNDAPGQRLAAELVRRLSASRCLFVEYPEGCKDLNDVLMKHGAPKVSEIINGAKPYPVRGLYRLLDYPPDSPEVPTFLTGWPTMDRTLKLFAGEFMVVTGIPSHGKSTWVLNLAANLGERYGWRSAIFSPEMPTVPHLRDKLRRIKLRGRPLEIDRQKIAAADRWINDTFVFIDSDPTGAVDEDFDLDWILDRATDAVLRDGVRLLIIDPWNEVEHARKASESMTDYIGRSIRSLKRFARLYGVAVIVIAHPTKDVAKEGKSRQVSLYDIEGSAHWFNKCDHGIVIDRPGDADHIVVRVAKVRFEETGERNTVKLDYQRDSGRYEILPPLAEGRAA